MSASYQTSAKLRGRREGDSVTSLDRHSPNSTSSHASQRLSKTTSRTVDDVHTSRSRPGSPALFWQRNKAADPSRSKESIVISPRASAASVKEQPKNDAASVPTSPTKSTKSLSSKKSAESARASSTSIGFGMDNMASSMSSSVSQVAQENSINPDASHKSSRPGSKASSDTLSQPPVAPMQPTVSDLAEEEAGTHISQPVSASQTHIDASSLKNSELGEGPSVLSRPTTHPDPGPYSYEYQPPNTSTPAISPPSSPRLYHQNPYGSPQLGAYSYAYPPSVAQSHMLPGGFYPAQYLPPLSGPAYSSPHSQESEILPSMQGKEEHQRILEKVTNILPDINRLLEHYQATQGELSAKELLVKQTELQRTEEIAKLRLELDAKKEEYEKLIEKIFAENYKYKMEAEEKDSTIESLQADASKHATLQDEFATLQAKHNDAVSAADTERLGKEVLVAEKLQLDKEFEEQKKNHTNNIENLVNEHKNVLEAKDKDHHKAASEHKVVLSKVQMELASLITKHSQLKKELDASKGIIAGLEEKLTAKSKELEEAAVSHLQQLASQLESLTSQRQQEVQKLQESHDQCLKDLAAEHEAKAANITEEHQSQLTKLTGELDGHKSAFSKLQAEHNDLGAKHGGLVGAMTSWKTRHEEWQAENDKLNGLLETLGQSSKSAAYYREVFEQLAHNIEIVSRNHFSHPPVRSPVEQSMFLEFGMPDVFGSTEAACVLRSLLVQHKIFKVLNARIFQRFLFVPFDDHPDADLDRILGGLSSLIGQKSVRREALWRSIVLKAIFTSSEGRATARVVAVTAYREIMHQIQAFANLDDRDGLAWAVKQIVKCAVELWRHARIEIDCISSSMPDTSNYHRGSDVVFWIRPHIVRECIGGMPGWGRDGDARGERQVLLEGLPLSRNSPLVSAREQELAQTVDL